MKSAPLMVWMVCITAASAFASDAVDGYKKLAGSYAISSKNLIDPAPGEKQDRAVFFLEGDSAMDIYNRMSGSAIKDTCAEELLTKTSGGLTCSKEVGSSIYTCTFGVMLKSGALVEAKVC